MLRVYQGWVKAQDAHDDLAVMKSKSHMESDRAFMSIRVIQGGIQKITKTVLIIAGLGLAATGCASVKISNPENDRQQLVAQVGAKERVALKMATRDLGKTPWPEITDETLSVRMVNAMFGVPSKTTGMSREDALEIYAMRLRREASPEVALLRDANLTLRQARQVAEAGRMAAVAINPNSTDIVVLEGAISDVRECREMYLAALKMLRKEGHEFTKQEQTELKAAFSQTIQDIGSTADLVAERLSANRIVPQLAGTAASTPSN